MKNPKHPKQLQKEASHDSFFDDSFDSASGSDSDLSGIKLGKRSRKDKGLITLTQNLLAMFEDKDGQLIDINSVAAALKVTKRRMYDITNVLESIKLVTKVDKNLYRFNGRQSIDLQLPSLDYQKEDDLFECDEALKNRWLAAKDHQRNLEMQSLIIEEATDLVQKQHASLKDTDLFTRYGYLTAREISDLHDCLQIAKGKPIDDIYRFVV